MNLKEALVSQEALGLKIQRVNLNTKNTSGRSAVKGGIPVINSNKMIPTDHQSAA
jgi:hypothetical protein